MASRNYDMIAIDLDGTLLGPDGRVSRENTIAIERARAEGLRVMIATGRGLVESEKILRSIDQRDPVAVAGGALTSDPVTQETIDRQPMQTEIVRHAIDEIHRSGHAALVLKDAASSGYDYLVLEGDHGAQVDPVSRFWFEMTGVTVRYAARLEHDEHPELTIRVGMAAVPEEAGPIGDRLRSAFGADATFHKFTTQAGKLLSPDAPPEVEILEVFDSRVTKWAAVLRQASRFGVDPARIAAVGDEVNDLSMIAGAALGIAMGNAVPEIKAASDVVTEPHDNDGVARAIERILSGVW